MDYEKAYKESLEKAKGIINYYKEHNRGNEAAIEDLEEIFPELKESKYEKIRRNIIAALKGEGYYDCDLTNECITWIEKQGEQKSFWSEEDETGLTNTIIMLKEGASLHFNKKDITKAVEWLKSLKERLI